MDEIKITLSKNFVDVEKFFSCLKRLQKEDRGKEVLFITGPYASGKSFISDLILEVLYKDRFRVVSNGLLLDYGGYLNLKQWADVPVNHSLKDLDKADVVIARELVVSPERVGNCLSVIKDLKQTHDVIIVTSSDQVEKFPPATSLQRYMILHCDKELSRAEMDHSLRTKAKLKLLGDCIRDHLKN